MKTPVATRLARYVLAVRERQRLLVEGLGAALIVCAVLMFSLPLGVLVAGVMLVLAANFYMGADDAGADGDDSQDSAVGR